VNGHSLKLHFCIFERSQVKHKSLDCYKFLKNNFHQLQSLHVQSLTQIKNVFTCSKHSSFKSGQSFFFSIKRAPFLLKIQDAFKIDY